MRAKLSVRRRLARMARDEDGGVTVEYVLIFVPMISLIFFIFEFAVGAHFTLSAGKATAEGARMAAVTEPVHCDALVNAGGQRTYTLDTTNFTGYPYATSERHCLNSPSPCATFAQSEWVCTSGDTTGRCNQDAFNAIYRNMARLSAGLEPGDVRIRYTDSRLGYVNGPAIPLITVSITDHRFEVNKLALGEARYALPAVSTTIIGEGLGAGKPSGC